MRGVPRTGDPARYELTVAGALGPVLRSALVPFLAGPSHASTVLRTAGAGERDLVDLLQLLSDRGLDVEDILLRGSPGEDEAERRGTA